MFPTSTSYDVTSSGSTLQRKSSKASTLIRDIKRKSLRSRKRVDSVDINKGKTLLTLN